MPEIVVEVQGPPTRAEFDELSKRVGELEADKDRVSVHVYSRGQSSLPPQVRKHGPTAIIVTIVLGVLELARYLSHAH